MLLSVNKKNKQKKDKPVSTRGFPSTMSSRITLTVTITVTISTRTCTKWLRYASGCHELVWKKKTTLMNRGLMTNFWKFSYAKITETVTCVSRLPGYLFNNSWNSLIMIFSQCFSMFDKFLNFPWTLITQPPPNSQYWWNLITFGLNSQLNPEIIKMIGYKFLPWCPGGGNIGWPPGPNGTIKT